MRKAIFILFFYLFFLTLRTHKPVFAECFPKTLVGVTSRDIIGLHREVFGCV